MLFNSIAFLIFFPVVTTLYFLLGHKYRWFLLLAASCFFYMYLIPVYILVLFALITIDYFAGILIENAKEHKQKKMFLIVSIIATCGVLFIFKYFNFFNANMAFLAQVIGWNYSIAALHLLLPVGLSFHTFQSLSYVIEVYYGRQKAERNFGIYALFVMFYPQLVAGPIERSRRMLYQFYEEHYFDYVRVTDGLKLMVWGIFKKVVIADRLAVLVNRVYANPQAYEGPQLILATVFFAVQVYCDFSGYSDIAIGSAEVMGFKLTKNFNLPYHARNVADFYKRWHISLSTWFRDYVYFPIYISLHKKGELVMLSYKYYFSIFITFLLSGLWHGANWTFVIWGALTGIYLVLETMTNEARTKTISFLKIDKVPFLLTFLEVSFTFALICFADIFFRSNSLSDAFYIITHLFSGLQGIFNLDTLVFKFGGLGLVKSEFLIAVFSILTLEFVEIMSTRIDIRKEIHTLPVCVRWALYSGIVYVILLFGSFNNTAKFIYFQF